MFAVIFKAQVAQLDEDYGRMAARLRDLARDQYGCREFVSASEGDLEIAISYWDSEDQIRRWKQDAEHQVAQAFGRSKWYKAYSVQVVQVLREYGAASEGCPTGAAQATPGSPC